MNPTPRWSWTAAASARELDVGELVVDAAQSTPTDAAEHAAIDIDTAARTTRAAMPRNMEVFVGLTTTTASARAARRVGSIDHDCETDVDECEPEAIAHCDPHGTCVNVPFSFTCSCGCYDYPDCSEEPCQHGGTCTEGPDGCEELNDQELVMVDC